MKRRALKLVIFLLLGAIINVAVAWGFSQARGQLIPYMESRSLLDDECAERLATHVSPDFVVGSGIEHRFVHHTTLAIFYWPEDPLRHAPEIPFGPHDWEPPVPSVFWVKEIGLPARAVEIEPELQIILPGFAINTIFYAAIVWGLFAVSGMVRRLRRRVRRKRGQCAACGYSLRGSSGGRCPECGATAIQNRAREEAAS